MHTLEEMAELARQFQEIHEPLAVWLDLSDKKFNSLEPKSADAEGIEKLIGELKHLQEEIAKREVPAKDLASLGKQLQDRCKGKDCCIELKVFVLLDGNLNSENSLLLHMSN